MIAVMGMQKLTTSSGYDYLTRQVAQNDAVGPVRTPLADYYDEKGEAPGVWVGSGLAGIDGLNAGEVVTAEEMGVPVRQGTASARCAAARPARPGRDRAAAT